MHSAEPRAHKSDISKPAGDRPANGTSFLAIPNSQSRSGPITHDLPPSSATTFVATGLAPGRRGGRGFLALTFRSRSLPSFNIRVQDASGLFVFARSNRM